MTKHPDRMASAFTTSQAALIDKCTKTGGGAAMFAISVNESGRCSDRQFLTMQRLHSASEYRRNNKSAKSSWQTRQDCAFSDYGDGGDF